MGRLGDELRAAADRADVPAGIDVDATVGAVKRRKAVRTAGPVALGVGALAIGGVAVAPLFGGFGSSAEETTADSAVVAEADDGADEAIEEDQALPENDAAGGTMLADPYMCGADADDIAYALIGYPASISADIPDQTIAERDGVRLATIETTTSIDDDSIVLLSGQPGAVILWEGIIVGLVQPEDVVTYGAADEVTLADGAVEISDGETSAVEVPLVNCWDGAALPPGNYEVLMRQSFAEQAYAVEEPVEGDESDLPSEASGIGWTFTIESQRLPFRVAGDVVDHPFDQYLG